MKIKCPGCGKVLSIPEAAAGKIVKCPCGKQLRAPGGAKTPAAGKPAAGKPATKPAASRPAAKSPAKPAAKPTQKQPARPAAAAPALDDDLFGELTDQDLAPVKSVYNPGQKVSVAKGAPPSEEQSAGGRTSGVSKVKLGFGVLLVIAGGGILIAYMMGVGGGDDEAGDTIRIRRRSPIGVGIGLIITGFGWAAAGMKGGKD